MNKRISELFEYGDEIVVTDEINGLFDPDEIKEITMKKLHAEHSSEYPQHVSKTSHRLLAVAVAACLALALGAAAYAANFLGIRELWQTPDRELPEEAANLIEPRDESAAATEGWSARITESLCDTAGAMVSLTISGGDRYIVAPTYASVDDPVSEIGLAGDETLGDYAAAQGKTLLLVGARLDGEDLGSFTQSQSFQNLADNEMAVLIRAEKSVSAASFDAICTVYAVEAGAEAVERLEIPLTLTEIPSDARILTPVDPDAIPGLHIGSATVTETPLGVNMTFPVDAEDAAIYSIGDVSCAELPDFAGGFVESDGAWSMQWTMGQGSLGETLTVHFYGQDGAPLGDIVFKK